MVYMYHSFLIHLSADGHLGCFVLLGVYIQSKTHGKVLNLVTLVNFTCNYNNFLSSPETMEEPFMSCVYVRIHVCVCTCVCVCVHMCVYMHISVCVERQYSEGAATHCSICLTIP